MKRICYFGDSLGKGVIFDTVRNRYVLLKDCFVNLFSEKEDITVKNHSKFGGTIDVGLSRLEKQQKDIEECDLVVLEYGGNDSNFNWDEISDNPDALHNPATPLESFVSMYKSMATKVIQMGKKVVALNLPPIDYQKYFEWISKGNNPENILRWLGGKADFIYRWHERYNNAVANIANSLQIPLIDIRTVFLEKRDYSDYLCIDGIHPNEQGHKLIADVLIGSYESKKLAYQI